MDDLKSLNIRHKKGHISKPEYINKMYNIHKVLFDYSEFIENTDISKIEIIDKLVIATSRGSSIRIICNKGDRRIAPIEILNFSYFEKNDFPMMLKLIDENTSFYDVGANIGWISLNVSKLKKRVKVYAFEPIPETFNALKENIIINEAVNVKSFNFGFSDEEKETIFYFNPEESVSASEANISKGKRVRKIRCKLKKMDNFTNKKNLKVDFIKCDVEGAEIFVIKGGLETIRKYKPVIFLEMLRKWSKKFNYSPNEIIKILKELGYNCYFAKDNRLVGFEKMDESTIQTNFFFLHRVKHASKIDKYTGGYKL